MFNKMLIFTFLLAIFYIHSGTETLKQGDKLVIGSCFME